MFANYVKSAFRNLWKNKITGAINITGLSVGMTAAVLILMWVQSETNFDDYKDKSSIYRVTTRIPTEGWVWETSPLLLAPAIKNEVPEVEKTARLYTSNQPVFSIGRSLFYEKECAYVDSGWFNLFQYNFTEGSPAAFNKNPFSIILTESAVKKYFGERSIVGQTIHVDSVDYEISGVVKDAPVNSSFQYKVFLPIAALLTNPQIRENDEQWNNDNYVTFIKTAPGANAADVSRKITGVVKRKGKDDNSLVMSLTPLSDMHFEGGIQNSIFLHGNKSMVYLFSFLGFLLLLIACINYVNLTTAKSSIRAKEVSIRKINGASRLSLFCQFVVESLLVSLLSLFVTLVLLQVCLPLFNNLTGKSFSFPLTSVILWEILVATLFASTLLNSIYPALLLSSFKPLNIFRGITVLKAKKGSFRKALVVTQFVVSVVLIAGTLIIYRQMQFIQKKDQGYNRSQVLSFALPYNIEMKKQASVFESIKQELNAQSSILGVTTANQPVVDMGSYCTGCANWTGQNANFNPKIAQLSADADFLKVMQLKMKEGRWFRPGVDEKHGFILNETAVKTFSLHEPVTGQFFAFKGDTGQVIGVVKDFSYRSLHEQLGPLVVFNNPQWRHVFMVRVSAQNASVALTAIEKTWKRYIPGNPFEYNFLDDSFARLYKQDNQASTLIFVFAAIAVLISSLGLFSLAAFEATQRTKEIGIRKVLGCSMPGITLLLSKDFIRLVGVAILIASPLAWWAMNRWLQNFAYRIEVSWWIFALAGLIALFIALVTVSFQAIKAAIANPVKSLRTE